MLTERAFIPNEITELAETADGQPIQAAPKTKPRKRWKYKAKFLKLGCLLLLYAVLLVVVQLKGSMLSYEIASLRQDITNIQTDNHRIEFQIQQLSSLARIEAIAIHELNMVRPEWNQSLTVARMVIPPVLADEYVLADTDILEPEKPITRVFNAFLALRQP